MNPSRRIAGLPAKGQTLVAAALAAALLAAAPLGSAHAQRFGPVESAPPTYRQDVSYKRDLHALARVLGTAHALRLICHGEGDQTYRIYMRSVLDLEAAGDRGLEDWLVGSFNTSYRDTMRNHRLCDDRARAREADLAAEGRDIALALADRHVQ